MFQYVDFHFKLLTRVSTGIGGNILKVIIKELSKATAHSGEKKERQTMVRTEASGMRTLWDTRFLCACCMSEA